jgi:hypothetical protein
MSFVHSSTPSPLSVGRQHERLAIRKRFRRNLVMNLSLRQQRSGQSRGCEMAPVRLGPARFLTRSTFGLRESLAVPSQAR